MRCLKCGAENPDNAIQCQKCHTTIRRLCTRCRAVNHQRQVYCGNCGLKLINICPRCKAQNSAAQRYCGNCGFKIINFCPNCGMNNPVGQRYCGNCATRLLPDQTGKPEKIQEQQVPKPMVQKTPPQQNLPQRKPQPRVQSTDIQPDNKPSQPQQNRIVSKPEVKQTPQRLKEQPAVNSVTTPDQVSQPIKEKKTTDQVTPPLQELKKPTQIAKIETGPQASDYGTDFKEISPGPIINDISSISTISSEVNLSTPPVVEKILPPTTPEPIVSQVSVSEIIDKEDLIVEETHNESMGLQETTLGFQDILESEETTEIEKHELLEFAVMSIEITNLNYLSELLDKQIVDSISARIWSIVNAVLQSKNEQIISIGENIGITTFSHSDDKHTSFISSLESAKEIFKLLNAFNQQLYNQFKIESKIKIGIATNNSPHHSELERSMAKEGCIIVSEEIKRETEGLFNFFTIGPLPIGNKMITFYKLMSSSGQQAQIQEEALIDHARTQKSQPVEVEEHMPEPEIPVFEQTETAQQVEKKILGLESIIGTLINCCNLTNNTGKGQFVLVSGMEGTGKTTSIRLLKSSLPSESYSVYTIYCNFQDKLFPLAAVKSLLRSIFSIPSVVLNKEEAMNKLREQVKILLGPDESYYNLVTAFIFGHIAQGFSPDFILKTIYDLLNTISQGTTVVLVIEDLDFIDSSSLELLEALINSKLLDLKVSIIATCHDTYNLNEAKPLIIKNTKYSQLQIKPPEPHEIDQVIQGVVQTPLTLPDQLKEQLVQATQNIPVVIELALYLMRDMQVILIDQSGLSFNQSASHWQVPPNIQEILNALFGRLNQTNQNAFILLQMAATLGPKISYTLLKEIAQQGKQFDETLQVLTSMGYLIFEDADTLCFKHNIIWEFIYYATIPNENKQHNHIYVITHLDRISQAGGYIDLAYMAYHTELAGKKRLTLNYWNYVANIVLSLAAPVGYNELMQRYLALLEITDMPNKEQLMINASEGLAKVAYFTNPDLALIVLSKLVPLLEKGNDIPKLIEYRGYIAYSLQKQGKYKEAVEILEQSLALINPETSPLDYAMLLTSLLEPMECMGKIAWIYNTARVKIIPVLEQALENKQLPENTSDEQLFRLLANVKFHYTNALTEIGHSASINIYEEIRSEVERRGLQDITLKFFILRIKANAIIGDVKSAVTQLNMSKDYLSQVQNVESMITLWLEAACCVFMEMSNWEALSQIIENAKSHSKFIKHYPLYALSMGAEVALSLGRDNTTESRKLANSLMAYAQKYSLNSYILMAYYYQALIEIATENYDKAINIINTALEAAIIPEISNLTYQITFKRLLGETYIKKGDIEIAKNILEDAIRTANDLQNTNHVAKISFALGLLHQELIAHSEDDKVTNAQKAYQFFANALNIFNQQGNTYQLAIIEQAIENFQIVCRINSIDIG